MANLSPIQFEILNDAFRRYSEAQKIENPYLNKFGQISNVQSIEKNGFILESNYIGTTNFSLLINCFNIIFSSTGYLCKKEEKENTETLKLLFSGGQLKSVNRIKWNSQIHDKRNTGSDTWKQLYYIFHELIVHQIIISNGSEADSIKSAIGYRLINAFTNGDDKPVLEYQDIDNFLYQLTRLGQKSKTRKGIELPCPKCIPPESLKESVNILIHTLVYGELSHD